MIQSSVERSVKLSEHLDTLHIAVRDVVKLRLHACSEPDIHNVGEELLQHGAYGSPALCRVKSVAFARYVVSVYDSANYGGVSARSSDAKFLQCADEVSFGVARRWLSELLIAIDLQEVKRFAFNQRWQPLCIFRF